MQRTTWYRIPMFGVVAAALTVAACRDEPSYFPPEVGGPQFSHLAGNTDVRQDTWLSQTKQNDNFGDSVELDLRESAKNRILVQFNAADIQSASDFITATGGRILLRLTIVENPGDWGPTGRPLDVHRMLQGWDGEVTGDNTGATYNCADDQDLGNNQVDCPAGDEWDVKKGASNPWVSDPTASAIVSTGQTGVVEFDVTDDIVAFAAGTQNYGWVVKRFDEAEAGAVTFGSFENVDFAPELGRSVCPEGTTCGETEVTIDENGNHSAFNVAASQEGATVIRLDVDANQVEVAGDPGGELIFALVKVTDVDKCLGLADPSLEVGPCWEGRAISAATGEYFPITFKAPQLIAACIPGVVSETRASELYGLVRRQQTDRSKLSDLALEDEAPLQVLKTATTQLPLSCAASELGSLGTNPVLRLAGFVWNKVTEPFSPRPLNAAAVAVVYDKQGKTSEIPGLSFFSYAKLVTPYRDGGYTWLTVGKKNGQLPCLACDTDRAPRDWHSDGFNDSGWNTGPAAFGSTSANTACSDVPGVDDLSSTVESHWSAADPRFNPPQITELLLRKNIFIADPTDLHTGGVSLQIRIAGRNDFRAYLNGTEVTEYVTQPIVNLKKSKGWIELAGGCPAYDEVIITLPESLIRFGQDNLLAVHARSSADEPSFADVQVNVDEAN